MKAIYRVKHKSGSTYCELYLRDITAVQMKKDVVDWYRLVCKKPDSIPKIDIFVEGTDEYTKYYNEAKIINE